MKKVGVYQIWVIWREEQKTTEVRERENLAKAASSNCLSVYGSNDSNYLYGAKARSETFQNEAIYGCRRELGSKRRVFKLFTEKLEKLGGEDNGILVNF